MTATRRPRVAPDVRAARTCYDHLAGVLGVALTEELVNTNVLALSDQGYGLTVEGARRLVRFGIDLDALRHRRRPLTRRCLDWTERRPHLAGALGAALTRRLFELSWIDRTSSTRAVRLTPAGRVGLEATFGLVVAL